MSHVPHELHEEFPEHQDKLQTLKQSNAHFAKLSEDYHDLNRAIHRAETDIAPTDDLNMAQMRKTRMLLKDQIYSILQSVG